MSDNQLYANGRIAVLSNKLLGQDKFIRLAESNTVAEALKVLSESGYAGGMTVANPNEYEQILIAESDAAMALLKELCFDKNATAYFLCRYAYHNAKVLLKGKYIRIDALQHCFMQAEPSPEVLKECFVVDDYSKCSKNMAEACDGVDTQFADGNRSPQVVDIMLDKAMYADMRAYSRRSTVLLVKKLFDLEVNTVNLMMLYRLKKACLNKDSLDKWFVDGGSVKKEMLSKLWDNDACSCDLPDPYRKFYSLCTTDNVNLASAEAQQKALRNKVLQECADMLSIEPVVTYFYNKMDEIDKVRYTLIGIKSGLDKDAIKNATK